MLSRILTLALMLFAFLCEYIMVPGSQRGPSAYASFVRVISGQVSILAAVLNTCCFERECEQGGAQQCQQLMGF